jgi:hypothetical protein
VAGKKEKKSVVKGEHSVNSVRPLVGVQDGEVAGSVWLLELATLLLIGAGSYCGGIGSN